MSSLRFIASYIARQRVGFSIGLLFLLIATSSQVAVTGLQKWIIDDIVIAGNYRLLTSTLLAFGGAVIGLTLFGVLWTHVGRVNAYRVNAELTEDMMTAIFRTPTAVYNNERIGKYVSYFTNDINMLTMGLTNFVPNGIANLISTLILAVIIGWSSPPLLLAIIGFSGLYLLLGKKFSAPIRRLSREVQEAQSGFLVHMEEGVSSTREVIAFHREPWERRKINEQFAIYYDAAMREARLDNRRLLWSDPLKWGATLTALGYGGYLVMQGQLSIGMYVIIFQFTSQMMTAIHDLYAFAMQTQSLLAMVDRLRSVVQGPQLDDGHRTLEGPIVSIELDNVSFRYQEGTPLVLDRLSLQLPIGGEIAFVGMSGGGKSTIAQLLGRFYDPDEGELLINGVPLRQLRRDAWTERLAIVFQDPYLFPDTIRNNVAMGRSFSDEEVELACRHAQLHHFILTLPSGYETELGERGINLSGGQKQRLAIARALIRRTELLILDEATSSLDLETERLVQQQIDELRRGQTTIVIAHRLSTVQNADLICVMERGAIVEQGTHDELMARDTLYKRLVYSQLEAAAV